MRGAEDDPPLAFTFPWTTMVTACSAAGRDLSDTSSQRSVGLGLLRLLRLPLGDPLRDGAAFQKPARLRFEPCARTADAIVTWRDSHKREH